MCPELSLLEQLALGLLSSDESAPLEEHLVTCERCLQTLIERNPADTLVEALREAPRTAERRAAFDDDIRRLEAALAARPWGGLPRPSGENVGDGGLRTQEYEGRDDLGRSPHQKDDLGRSPHQKDDLGRSPHEFDTSPSASGRSTDTPPTQGDAADESELYDLLAPAQLPDEMGRLGNYRVLRVLGTGGMGVVFEAEDLQLKRHVALKAMKPGGAVSSASRKRFLREAQAAAAVEHDHIVPVYQVGEDRGVPFIAMPLLRGETLAERLEKGSGQGSGKGQEAALPLPPGEGRGEGGGATTGATPQSAFPVSHRSPPRWRFGLVCGAAAAAALLAGILITIKNEKDETVAQFEAEQLVGVDNLAPGHKLTIEQKPEGKAADKRQKAEDGSRVSVEGSATEPKTQDESPKTVQPNPKSKIQNPKSKIAAAPPRAERNVARHRAHAFARPDELDAGNDRPSGRHLQNGVQPRRHAPGHLRRRRRGALVEQRDGRAGPHLRGRRFTFGRHRLVA